MMSTTIPYRKPGSYAAADYSAHFPGATEFLPDMQAVDGLNEANRLNQQFTMRNIVDATNQFRTEGPALYEAAKREQAQGFAGPATKRFAQLQASLTGQNIQDRSAANSMRVVGPFVSTIDRNNLDLFKMNAPYRDEARAMRNEGRQDRQLNRQDKLQDTAKQRQDRLDQEVQDRYDAGQYKQAEQERANQFTAAINDINSGTTTDPMQLRRYPGLNPSDYAQLRAMLGTAGTKANQQYDATADQANNANTQITETRMAPFRSQLMTDRLAAEKKADGYSSWNPFSVGYQDTYQGTDADGNPTLQSGQRLFGDDARKAANAQAEREYNAQIEYAQQHPESLVDQDNERTQKTIQGIQSRYQKMPGMIFDPVTGLATSRDTRPMPYRRGGSPQLGPNGFPSGWFPDDSGVPPLQSGGENDGLPSDWFGGQPAQRSAPSGARATRPAYGTPESDWPIVPHLATGDLWKWKPDGEYDFYAPNPNKQPDLDPTYYGQGVSMDGGFSGQNSQTMPYRRNPKYPAATYGSGMSFDGSSPSYNRDWDPSL